MIIGVYPPRTGLGPTALGYTKPPSMINVQYTPRVRASAPSYSAGGGADAGALPDDGSGGESAAPPFGLPTWWKTGALAVAVGLGALLVLRKKPA